MLSAIIKCWHWSWESVSHCLLVHLGTNRWADAFYLGYYCSKPSRTGKMPSVETRNVEIWKLKQLNMLMANPKCFVDFFSKLHFIKAILHQHSDSTSDSQIHLCQEQYQAFLYILSCLGFIHSIIEALALIHFWSMYRTIAMS